MVEGYSVSSNLEDMDFAIIHDFLSKSYWSTDIPLETLRRATENSLCFGVFADSCAQVGFARMITDTATFAYLADVFILDDHRGKRLSKWLMQLILDHPKLQGLRRIALATKDAHSLYEQFGFKALANPEMFMELWEPVVYTKA